MDSKQLIVILLALSCVWCSASRIQAKEKEILNTLLSASAYDPTVIPRPNSSEKPALSYTNLYVRRFGKMDEENQELSGMQITLRQHWNDARLEFDNQGGQLRYLTLDNPRRIWQPDIFFSNEIEGHFHHLMAPNRFIKIYPNGDVLYSVRLTLTLACPMSFNYFPMDVQTCSIKIASYGLNTEDLILLWKEGDPVQITKHLNLPNMYLRNFNVDYCVSKTNSGEYSCLVVHFQLERDFSQYFGPLFLSAIFLVILSWLPFYLPSTSSTSRLFFSLALLFIFSSRSSSFYSAPHHSSSQLLNCWTTTCFFFILASLVYVGVILAIAKRFPCFVKKRKVPREEMPIPICNIIDADGQKAETTAFPPPKKTLDLKGRIAEEWFPNLASRFDLAAKIIFPLAFIIFNIVFWVNFKSALKLQRNFSFL